MCIAFLTVMLLMTHIFEELFSSQRKIKFSLIPSSARTCLLRTNFSLRNDMNMPPYENQSFVKSNQGTSTRDLLELQSTWSRHKPVKGEL